MITYRLVIVTGHGPLESPPLHTRTFDADSDHAAVMEATGIVKELVTNPEEEYGVLVSEGEWVADIDVSRDEEVGR
jgi:hypothetical protein